MLYVESNRLEPGQNSILAYSRAADGTLTPLPGSPFLTNGKGLNNPTAAKLGPNDKDYPLLASRDKKRLYAVNSGSNTIAVFDVGDDGRLRHVPGSPFPSGGRSPVSLTIAGRSALRREQQRRRGSVAERRHAELHRLRHRLPTGA